MNRTFRTEYQPLNTLLDENIDDDQEVPPSNNIVQVVPEQSCGKFHLFCSLCKASSITRMIFMSTDSWLLLFSKESHFLSVIPSCNNMLFIQITSDSNCCWYRINVSITCYGPYLRRGLQTTVAFWYFQMVSIVWNICMFKSVIVIAVALILIRFHKFVTQAQWQVLTPFSALIARFSPQVYYGLYQWHFLFWQKKHHNSKELFQFSFLILQ